ncbi:putative sugar phosphatase of the HAD superfamily [Caenispirillum salinarum AK4]|uniref:Putative sugar phosphatase of the HAD superfamily n=1 Tax=Caenispirillum salinarum AK4 TaxID=1238182 RepID=K9H299_9PROT|nr:TIGR01459 family HAD-type hydrolase [Caenispirillum salinarum]EKV31677.1 putative sugar phosphatase of the HAD superfamily [Caenispirillum salinarum AK4]
MPDTAQLPAEIPLIDGVRALAERYDAFILDLWGVIHDGQTAYPDAAETLAALREAGRKTILLSNAPRRAHTVAAAMERMGLSGDLYGDALTSGEAVRMELLEPRDPFYRDLGPKVFFLGRSDDDSVLEGLGDRFEKVADPAAADWVLNTGPRNFTETLDDLEPVLRDLAAEKLPMVCANPDRVVIRAGERIICAGLMAERYEEIGGGPVSWRGKPDRAVYALCLERLGVSDKSRVCTIGDSFHTDIAGAAAAGIDAVLCTGGIHAEDLGVRYGEPADPRAVAGLARREGVAPAPVGHIAAFRW